MTRTTTTLKLYLLLICILAGLLALSGCSSSGSKKTPAAPAAGDPPLSRQAVLVESYSASEVLIRATGLGNSMSEARQDARKAALWFVLHGGNTPMLTDQTQRQAFARHEKHFYTRVMDYITHEGEILSRRVDGKQDRIERAFRINLDALRNDLITRNIISSAASLSAQISNPQISVITADQSTHSIQAATVFSEYLQRRGFQVVVTDASERINQVVQQATALSGTLDPTYLLALQTGSDIYISITAETASRTLAGNTLSQATVTATAYYTATGNQLGAATGYSTERVVSGSGAIMGEAANDAADKVLNQLTAAWLRESAQGRSYKVVASAEPGIGDISRPIHQLFSQVCSQSRRNAAGSSSFDYILTCETRDVMDLLFKLEDHWRGPGQIFRVMDSGAFLVIRIGFTDSDDIIIE